MTYFHEEQSFRQWWLPVLLAVVALPVVVVLAMRGPVLEVIVLPLVVLAIGALFAFARLVVDVDREAITIAFHLLWPKRRIALASVRRAEATKYRPLIDYGGYGVETTDGARVMIGSQRPKELEAAIALAKRALGGPPREAEPH